MKTKSLKGTFFPYPQAYNVTRGQQKENIMLRQLPQWECNRLQLLGAAITQ